MHYSNKLNRIEFKMTFCLYRAQQVQYRLRRRGYARRDYAWVNADRCDCHFLIAQYHIRMRAELENRLREMTIACNILQDRVQTLTGPTTGSAARLLHSGTPRLARAPALVRSRIVSNDIRFILCAQLS